MSNQEILEKAITKAIDGGWNPYNLPDDKVQNGAWIKRMAIEATAMRSRFDLTDTTTEIIFNHDFARSLWGAEQDVTFHPKKDNRVQVAITGYRHHLQQMVIAKDPIRYLGEHLQ